MAAKLRRRSTRRSSLMFRIAALALPDRRSATVLATAYPVRGAGRAPRPRPPNSVRSRATRESGRTVPARPRRNVRRPGEPIDDEFTASSRSIRPNCAGSTARPTGHRAGAGRRPTVRPARISTKRCGLVPASRRPPKPRGHGLASRRPRSRATADRFIAIAPTSLRARYGRGLLRLAAKTIKPPPRRTSPP